MTLQPTHYDLFDLPQDATPDEIRHAYHEAARRLHPDVNTEPGATEQFLSIQKAYEVLIDETLRTQYNIKLAQEDKTPIKKQIYFSREAISILDEPQLIYVLLEFSADPDLLPKIAPPINIGLVIDRSTSMQGERMDTVKQAAIELIKRLKSDDILSIVVFSDRAEVLLSAGRLPDRSIIESQIRMLRPGGGTEIFPGLQAGILEVQRYSAYSPINHIILITDGRTYGDENASLSLADRAILQGIRITGLGIGSDWNDTFMDELTSRTGGECSYIANAHEIQNLLKEKFDSFSQNIGEQTCLELNTEPGVSIKSIFRFLPSATELHFSPSIQLGSIPTHNKLAILVEFVIDPIVEKTSRVKLATGSLNTIVLGSPNAKIQIPFSLSRKTQATPDGKLPPAKILQALTQINMYKMQEHARIELAEGKYQQASTRLQHLATHLIDIGERELAHTALMEAERIQRIHVLSPEGEKKIKYGTRSLLLPNHPERGE